MSKSEKPLITFALFAYNQEQFIREAIGGAFAQTYSPLEIILSDDCSTDGTFQLIAELASEYIGPHKIILNRNPTNLGLGDHINKVMGLCNGELIVVAAGDDISLPSRTATIAKVWLEHEKKPSSIYSKSVIIDSKGMASKELDSPLPKRTLEENLMHYMSGVQGCSHAWSRQVFDVFGQLLIDTVCEDRVIPLRSMLMGGIKYIPDVLVEYRVHDSNISHFSSTDEASIIDTTIKIYERNMNICRNYLVDLGTAQSNNLLDKTIADNLSSKLIVKIDLIESKIEFLNSGLIDKLRLIASGFIRNPKQSFRWFIIMLLPSIYIASQKKNLRIS